MTISGKEPFHRHELHELELNMLSDNTIHTLLPMSWLEVDDRISFNYEINGYRLITHVLRTEQLTMKQYYSLLLSIADGLATCYDYMLRPQCCMLDEQVMYIDDTKERIGLAYLPLRQPLSDQLGQSLLLLAVRWSSLVADLDTAGYHRILQLLSAAELPIHPLRQLLLDLIHEQTQTSVKQSLHDRKVNEKLASAMDQESFRAVHSSQHAPPSRTNHGEEAYKKRKLQLAEVNEAQHQDQQEVQNQLLSKQHRVRTILESSEPPAFKHIEELEDDELELDEEDDAASLTWKHAAVAVLIVAAIGLSWFTLYAEKRSFDQLLLCSGITIGLLALLGLLLFKPIKTWMDTRGLGEPISFELMTEHAVHASSRLQSLQTSVEEGVPKQVMAQPAAPSSVSEGKPHSALRVGTAANQPKVTPKSHSLATVQLDGFQATVMLNQQPMLVRTLHGKQENIMLGDAPFLIGRAEEGVHYQEEAKGVSRVHLELEWRQGRLEVKDVGSRNGTYLNGQLMVAYKVYSLQAGDKLQLASQEGPIYELVS